MKTTNLITIHLPSWTLRVPASRSVWQIETEYGIRLTYLNGSFFGTLVH